MQEMTQMYVYKLVKSGECRDYEILALILFFRKLGYCKEEFYEEKLAELFKDNSEEVYDLFYDLSIPAPEGGDEN